MLRFLVGRLIGAVVVLWAIMTLSFFLMRFAPGSPFDADRRLPPAVEANKWVAFGMGTEVVAPVAGVTEVVAELAPGDMVEAGTLLAVVATGDGAAVPVPAPHDGAVVATGLAAGQPVRAGARLAVLERPLGVQYLEALGRYARLDFGVTLTSDGTRTVAESLAAGLPVSLELGLWALLLALLLGVSAGLAAGWRPGTWLDHGVMALAMTGISVPTLVSGPLLVAAFVLGLHWLPYGGWDTWQHRVLPAVTLGLVYTTAFARLTRGGMLEVIRADWIRTARAKGLSEGAVVGRHALRGAILPTVSFLGPATASLVTGSVVVERIFDVPGLSEYFVSPALSRDYPMVLGAVFVYSAVLVVMNLVVDLAYAALDPRVSVRG